MKSFLIFSLMLCSFGTVFAQDGKLRGTVIGTTVSVDYSNNGRSTTVNTREQAFDGDLSTYFASYDRSYTWVGLDLGEPHVITRVGWCPAWRSKGIDRIVLAVFEGANSPDFMDALPLYIITERGVYGQMDYADVTCSKGFRYVRYVGPSDQRCNIAELEFYGHAGEGDESNLYRLTNLPVVSIHTANGAIPADKKNQIDAILTVISDKGKELLQDSGTVRLRGNYSINFPKKPYRIKFNKKKRVLDAPAKAKKWTLISNYGDKTIFRNMLAFELSRSMDMPYTSYIQPVDVLLNGEYKGCYQLCDQIDVRKNRVDIEEMTPEDDRGLTLTGGYLVEVDARASSETSWFMSAMGTPVTIHYPDDDEIIPEQHTYIEYFFNTMEENWKKYLDLNTFLRHFFVGELSGNTDTYWSVYMYKHRGNDTIFTGPVWDFDLAFENDKRTYPVNSKKDFLYRSGGSVTGKMREFVDRMCVRDAEVRAKMLEIWSEVRNDKIQELRLVDYTDQQEEYLQQSQKLNFMRWPIMDELVHQNPVIWGSYEAEVENVRRFLKERIAWMDNKLGYVGDTQGIADINREIPENHPASGHSSGEDYYYTLSGQRLQVGASEGRGITRPSKGLYIVRGRKVIVR